ncbi:MAG: hypothetical protein AAFX06_08735 [Planctomycetota bacterium]
MARERAILVQTYTSFRLVTFEDGVVRTTELDDSSQSDSDEAIADWIEEEAGAKLDVVIATSASSTLAVTIPLDEFGEARGRIRSASLEYLIEEHLPWSAEEFEATTTSHSDRVFGLALRSSEWSGLCETIRDRGHEIIAIVPSAILAFDGLMQLTSVPAGSCVVGLRDGAHFFLHANGVLESWKFWPRSRAQELNGAHLLCEIAFLHALQSLTIDARLPEVFGCAEAAGLSLSPIEYEACDDELIWKGTQRLWRKRTHPLSLLTGRLAGSALVDATLQSSKIIFASVIAVLVCLCCGLLWKSHQLGQLKQDVEDQQVELYQQTFPDTPIPLGISSRFESQHRAIVGQRGSAGTARFPEPVLIGLKHVLSVHNTEIRSQFHEIEIIDGEIEIECEFRNRSDASEMLKRLNDSGLAMGASPLQKLDDRRIGTRLRGRVGKEASP